MRYEVAVQEAFYWGEILDNGGSFKDYGETPSPGTTAALSGLWRGRNRADNEASSGESNEATRKQREGSKERYGRE